MKLLRNFLILAIVANVVLGVLIRYGRTSVSPACSRADVQERLAGILADAETDRGGAAAVRAITGVSETGYDKVRDLRSCAAVASFADGTEATLLYTTEWEDRAANRFAVLLQPYSR